jgi:hypothetical protein
MHRVTTPGHPHSYLFAGRCWAACACLSLDALSLVGVPLAAEALPRKKCRRGPCTGERVARVRVTGRKWGARFAQVCHGAKYTSDIWLSYGNYESMAIKYACMRQKCRWRDVHVFMLCVRQTYRRCIWWLQGRLLFEHHFSYACSHACSQVTTWCKASRTSERGTTSKLGHPKSPSHVHVPVSRHTHMHTITWCARRESSARLKTYFVSVHLADEHVFSSPSPSHDHSQTNNFIPDNSNTRFRTMFAKKNTYMLKFAVNKNGRGKCARVCDFLVWCVYIDRMKGVCIV